MPKKLSEAEVLERMRKAHEDAISNPHPQRAREARGRLRYWIKKYPALAQANGIETVDVIQIHAGEIVPVQPLTITAEELASMSPVDRRLFQIRRS